MSVVPVHKKSLHNIFFSLTTAERMNLLALNRVARQRISNSRSLQIEGKKKISAWQKRIKEAVAKCAVDLPEAAEARRGPG